MTANETIWQRENQRELIDALNALAVRLDACVGLNGGTASPDAPLPMPRALNTVRELFGLSRFEAELLLLCAAPELDGAFIPLLATAQGADAPAAPTFSLALVVLSDPHWSAIAPVSPVRRYRLLELPASAGTITRAPLRLDERVLHFIAGVDYLDPRIAALTTHVDAGDELVESHAAVARRMAEAWKLRSAPAARAVGIWGADGVARRNVAAAVAAEIGLELLSVDAGSLPSSPAELDDLVRLWQRESVLGARGLLVECGDEILDDHLRRLSLGELARRSGGFLVISAPSRPASGLSDLLDFELPVPTAEEQQRLWSVRLPASSNGLAADLAVQFDLQTGAIASIARQVLGGRAGEVAGDGDLALNLRDACRAHARSRLDDLAQRIDARAAWDDLVLPGAQAAVLREIAAQVRGRVTVYDHWGFRRRLSRGLGISVLFAGSSGTGKTMAAEVLAADLGLDLYRIDLSQVVSKYIGETEKNLRRVFDAAESSGAILLFDEADALFGKRSEVRDSHDRYANIEVSYLLQRMEAYRGLAILTSNMRGALDPAFLRRIRFVVEFPFPDAALRAEIWSRVFPGDAPRSELDIPALARLNVAGGNIVTIALNGAFLAAEEGKPIAMRHLLRAARSEYAKLEKTLTDAEVRGWK